MHLVAGWEWGVLMTLYLALFWGSNYCRAFGIDGGASRSFRQRQPRQLPPPGSSGPVEKGLITHTSDWMDSRSERLFPALWMIQSLRLTHRVLLLLRRRSFQADALPLKRGHRHLPAGRQLGRRQAAEARRDRRNRSGPCVPARANMSWICCFISGKCVFIISAEDGAAAPVAIAGGNSLTIRRWRLPSCLDLHHQQRSAFRVRHRGTPAVNGNSSIQTASAGCS